MSRSMAMIGLLLVAGIVDGGPILNNFNGDVTVATSASNATSSAQRQGQPQSNPNQQQQERPSIPFGVNPSAAVMQGQQRPQMFHGLPTMPPQPAPPGMSPTRQPGQFLQQAAQPPRQVPMPPIPGLNQPPQSVPVNATRPVPQPPTTNGSKPAVLTTTPDHRRSVEEEMAATASSKPAKPFRETPLGNDQKVPEGPTLMKDVQQPAFQPIPMPVPFPVQMPMNMGMPMGVPMSMPMPMNSLVGMNPMMNPSVGFHPANTNGAGGFARPATPMWPVMWDPMWAPMWNPWMFPGAATWHFPTGNSFIQPNTAENQGSMGINSANHNVNNNKKTLGNGIPNIQ